MEFVSKTKEEKLRREINKKLIPSIISGLNKTNLVYNIHIKPVYNEYKDLQGVEIHYKRRRRANCLQLRESLDAMFLAHFGEQGIFLDSPLTREKARGRLVTARVTGIDIYNGNRIELLYDLFQKAEKTIWNFVDPSGKTRYIPPPKPKEPQE